MNSQEWKLIDRFKEPSSWAALAAAATTAGLVLPGQLIQALSFIGAGICVLLGVLLKEGGPTP